MPTNVRAPDTVLSSGGQNEIGKDEIFNQSLDTTIGELVSGLPHLRLRPDTAVNKILATMTGSGKRIAGIVEEDGTFAGFVTRSSLLGKLVMDQGLDEGGHHFNPAGLKTLTAADVMIRNPAFLPSELSLADALAIMTEYGYHAMPVLGDRGQLVGLAEMRKLRQAHRVAHSDLAAFFEDEDDFYSAACDAMAPKKTQH